MFGVATLAAGYIVVAQWSEHQQLRSEALGSIPQWLPMHFFLRYVSILIYNQFLPPVVRIVTKHNHGHRYCRVVSKVLQCYQMRTSRDTAGRAERTPVSGSRFLKMQCLGPPNFPHTVNHEIHAVLNERRDYKRAWPGQEAAVYVKMADNCE